jgi:hypothetical protein
MFNETELENLTLDQLKSLQQKILILIEKKTLVTSVLKVLSYNTYKGTGKCWIAIINPKTKKILSFLNTESIQKRDKYSGQKTFEIPLKEGQAYQIRETGSKSSDHNEYLIVQNGQLINLT